MSSTPISNMNFSETAAAIAAENLPNSKDKVTKADLYTINANLVATNNQLMQNMTALMNAFAASASAKETVSIGTNKYTLNAGLRSTIKQVSDTFLRESSWTGVSESKHKDHFGQWLALVHQLADLLNITGFIDQTMVVFHNGVNPSWAKASANLVFEDLSSISAVDDSVSSIGGIITSKALKIEVSDSEAAELQSTFKIIGNVIKLTVSSNPLILGYANVSGAVENANPILMVANLTSQFAGSTGVSICKSLIQLFRTRQYSKSNGHILSVTELLIELDRLRDELLGKKYRPDDFIMIGAVLHGLNSDESAANEVNKQITYGLVAGTPPTYEQICTFLRLSDTDRFQKHRSGGFNKSKSSTNRDGESPEKMYQVISTQSRLIMPGTQFDPNSMCSNCWSIDHSGSYCPAACRKCTFESPVKTSTIAFHQCHDHCIRHLKSSVVKPAKVKTIKQKLPKLSVVSITGDDVGSTDEGKFPVGGHFVGLTHPNLSACMDSGATTSASNQPLISSLTTSRQTEFQDAQGNISVAEGRGYIKDLNDVIVNYVPNFDDTLLSVSDLADYGNVLIFDEHGFVAVQPFNADCKNSLREFISKSRITMSGGRTPDRQYRTDYASSFPRPNRRITKHRAYTLPSYNHQTFTGIRQLVHYWHEALGHPSLNKMIQIAESKSVVGLSPLLTAKTIRKHYPKNCASCTAGNLARDPHSSTSITNTITSVIGDCVEIDLIVPLDKAGGNPMISKTGHQYGFVAVDIASDYVIGYSLKSRKDLVKYIKLVINHYKHQNKTIKKFKFDSEFNTDAIKTYLRTEGIQYEFAPPYEHNAIGTIERKNRTIQEMMIKTLYSSQVDRKLWPMIFRDSIFKNNIQTRKSDGISPYFHWYNRAFDVSKYPLIPFGSRVMAHVPVENQRKLEFKSQPTIALGINHNTPGGILLLTANNEIITRRTFRVINAAISGSFTFLSTDTDDLNNQEISEFLNAELFNITSIMKPSVETSSDGPNLDVTPPTPISSIIEPIQPIPIVSVTLPSPTTTLTTTALSTDTAPPTPPTAPASIPPTRQTRQSTPTIPHPYAKNPYAKQYSPRIRAYANKSVALERNEYKSYIIPMSVNQAKNSPESDSWMTALQSEFDSLKHLATFDEILSNHIPKERTIPSKIVFDIRYNANGSVKKFKCRLVARGDKQPWQTYGETYSETASSQSINILFSIIADMDMEMTTLDVKTAFLHSPVDEEIYMTRPPGIDDSMMPPVVKLNKCIYGLKQAAKAWKDLIHTNLISFGFRQLISDNCIYVKGNPSDPANYMILGLFVDDILIGSNNHNIILDLIHHLSQFYELDINHDPVSYLGMEIVRHRSDKTISLLQRGYIDQLITKYTIRTDKPVANPMESSYNEWNPIKSTLLSLHDSNLFMQKIGSLMFLCTRTRTDISLAVNILAGKAAKPTSTDMDHVDRIFRYILSTRDVAMIIRGGNGIKLFATVDAAYGNAADRRSRYGMTLHLHENSASIATFSKKQKCVTLSSTEAEYVAICESFKQINWCRMFLEEIGLKQDETIVYEDNMSTIHLLSQGNDKGRTKHIDIRYHYIREKIENHEITIQHLPTTDMTSDILTKPLPSALFVPLRKKLLGHTN
jgi:hypothetical protein